MPRGARARKVRAIMRLPEWSRRHAAKVGNAPRRPTPLKPESSKPVSGGDEMPVRSTRFPLAALLVVLGSALMFACKSVPPAPENVNPQTPKFESKPAEKVD